MGRTYGAAPRAFLFLIAIVLGACSAAATPNPSITTAPTIELASPSLPAATATPQPTTTAGAWVHVPDGTVAVGSVFADVGVFGSTFVAIGNQGGLDQAPRAWTSTDGISWQSAPFPAGPAPARLRATDAGLAAVGAHSVGDRTRLDYWTSPDGTRWVALPDLPNLDVDLGFSQLALGHVPAGDLVLGSGCTVVSGNLGVCRPFGFRRASDGTWARAKPFPIPSGAGNVSVSAVTVTTKGLGLAVGTACADNYGNAPCALVAWTSTDGLRWTMHESKTMDEPALDETGWRLSALAPAPDGSVLYATRQAGLWRFDGRSWSQLHPTFGGPYPKTGIWLLTPVGDHLVGLEWIESDGGVSYLLVRSDDGVTWKRVPGVEQLDGLPPAQLTVGPDRVVVTAFDQDNGGQEYVATVTVASP